MDNHVKAIRKYDEKRGIYTYVCGECGKVFAFDYGDCITVVCKNRSNGKTCNLVNEIEKGD